jgi:hypothetical protein
MENSKPFPVRKEGDGFVYSVHCRGLIGLTTTGVYGIIIKDFYGFFRILIHRIRHFSQRKRPLERAMTGETA